MAAKQIYEKDLYAVLGVKKSDDGAAIKKQYRKLARELHPDKTKGDKKLEERFKEVSEAYEVLSDDKKRSEYDEMRDAFKSGRIPQGGMPGGGNFQGNFSGADFQNLFGGGGGDIFSNLFGGGGFNRGPRRGQDLSTETSISFRDSIFGSEITLRINGKVVNARIPAGIKDGNKIKVKGKGGPGEGGAGDLIITVNVIKHPIFSRDDLNLRMELPVTFTEAALGADVKVPTLDGEEVTLRIAPGTSNGRVLRVKGRGVETAKGTGDLLVKIDVQVPQRVDGAAKKALEDFAHATKEYDPRKDLLQKAKA
jgi:molecular chaperone DnaJ